MRAMIPRVLGLGLAILALADSAGAERHALLVGVSRYPVEKDKLDGPPNDVAKMREHLLGKRPVGPGFKPEHIRVLVDDDNVEGWIARPTREAILRELDRLGSEDLDASYVFLFFSGHGSQQWAPGGASEAEPDGLDEIFLPADVGKWGEGKPETVDNAIVDDEIGARIARIRNAGSGRFVWAVFDSCHSGTVTRAGGPRARFVPPGALGVPARREGEPGARKSDERRPPVGAGGDDSLKGGFVAYFAAQSDQLTYEDYLPPGSGEWRGRFAYTLLQVLRSAGAATYAEVGQEILRRYKENNWGAYPTPVFSGPSRDAMVFGSDVGTRGRLWEITKSGEGELRMAGGRVDDLGVGSILALIPSAVSPENEVLTFVSVKNNSTFESVVEPVEYAGRSPAATSSLPESAFARLVEREIATALVVAEPAPDGMRPEDRSLIAVALSGIKQRHPGRFRWVPADTPAQVELALSEGHLQILDASGERAAAGGLSIVLDGKTGAAVADAMHENLSRIARYRALQVVAGEIGDKHRPTLRWFVGECGKRERELAADEVPLLVEGTRVCFELVNEGASDLDVTVLQLTGDYGVYPVFPQGDSSPRLLAAGDRREISAPIGKPTGPEQLLVLAVPAKVGLAPRDFRYLAQEAPPKERASRGTFEGILQDAVFGAPSIRSGAGILAGASVQSRHWRNDPR